MSTEKLLTDKMYLVHTTTGKRFHVATQYRSGWCVEVLQCAARGIPIGDQYINLLASFFCDTYNQKNDTLKSYDHFKTDSKEYKIEYESDSKGK